MQRLRRNRMKRNILMLLVVVFPYTLVLFLYLVFFNHLPQNWTIFEIYGCIILAWLFGLTGAICLAVSNASKRTDAKAAAKNNMLVKLLQIPAYILLFGIGALCSMLIFTWLVTFTIIVVDVMTMLLSGINGAAAVSKCRKEGLLSRNAAFWMGIAQFVYCVDVVCAVALVCTIVGQEHALKQSYNTGNMSIVQTEKDGVE